MKSGFNFGNMIKVLRSHSGISTFEQFIKSDESKKNKIKIYPKSGMSDWERINIFLSDNRLVKNIFLFKGEYIFGIRRWADNGNIARDSIEDFVFYPEICEELGFSQADIVYLEKNNKLSKKIGNWLAKRPIDKELLTTITTWTETPHNPIEFENDSA